MKLARCQCLDAVAHGGNPQDRNGAFSVGELNSPRVAPLHRFHARCPFHLTLKIIPLFSNALIKISLISPSPHLPISPHLALSPSPHLPLIMGIQLNPIIKEGIAQRAPIRITSPSKVGSDSTKGSVA